MNRNSAIDHEVIVVGAGPAGLLIAAELQRAGIDVAILERRTSREAPSRAIGVHPAALAALEPSGAAERIVSKASRITHGQIRDGRRILGEVRFDRLHARYPFIASVPQQVTEYAVADGGPEALRGVYVQRVRDRGAYVDVECRAAEISWVLRARVVVVAAGVRGPELIESCRLATRRYRDQYVMADLAGVQADAAEDTERAIIVLDREGVVESFPLPGGGRRLVAWDRRASRQTATDSSRAPMRFGLEASEARSPEVERSDAAHRLRLAVIERAGYPGLAARIDRVSTFGIRRALVSRLRYDRVIMIGDSAHEVSPIGGQGMNLGLLDAATLAQPLIAWIRLGEAPEALERWETRRLRSARTAARLAGVNTRLGRPKSVPYHWLTTVFAAGATAGKTGQKIARVYAMGLDRDSQISRRIHR